MCAGENGLVERAAYRLTSLDRWVLDGSAPDAAEVARSSIELLSTLLPEELLLDFCQPPTKSSDSCDARRDLST